MKDVNLDDPNDKAFHLESAWAAFFFSVRVSHSTTCFSLLMPHQFPPSPQILLPPGLHSLKSSIYAILYDLATQYSVATVS